MSNAIYYVRKKKKNVYGDEAVSTLAVHRNHQDAVATQRFNPGSYIEQTDILNCDISPRLKTGFVREFVNLPLPSLWASGYLTAHGKTLEQMRQNIIMEFCEAPESQTRVAMNIQSLAVSVKREVEAKLLEILQNRAKR